MQGCEALLCLLTDTIDREIISSNPALMVISNYAVGYNNIDLDYATSQGIAVCNTPGVLTDTTADLAWALLMSAARRIAEGDRMMREGKFEGWAPMLLLGVDINGKTLGIIGMGRIGQAVAKRAAGFGMRIIYYDEYVKPDALPFSAEAVRLTNLLQEADFISVHAPLTPETTHLIGKDELHQMKPTAILINTARGPIVDEKALVHALREKVISAAGLDVYEDEPLLAEGLTELPNVVIVPHIGSASIETRTKMGLLAAENAIAVLQGRKPPAIVNPEVLKG